MLRESNIDILFVLRDDRKMLIDMKKKRRTSTKEVKENNDLDLSNQTVRNRWREKGFRCREAATKPFISERNRKRRLQWLKTILVGL